MRFAILLGFLVLGLAGCGGGGSGDGTGGVVTPPAPAVRTGTVTLQGSVVKGPVAGSEVCAYALAGGAKGADVRLTVQAGQYTPAGGNFCVLTARDGSFAVTVADTYQGDLLLEAWGGFHCSDESQAIEGGCAGGGVKLQLANSDIMRTVVSVPASGTVPVVMTPLSTAAVAAAGSTLNQQTFQDRFTALARQVMGEGTTVTPTTPATLLTHPYLRPAAVNLLAGGSLANVVSVLQQGRSDFGVPPLRARERSTLTLDLDAAMARTFTGGAERSAPLVRGYVSLAYSWTHYAAAQIFEGTPRQSADLYVSWLDYADGVHKTTQTSTHYAFDTAPFRIYGGVDNTGRYSLTTESGLLPTAGRIDDTGLFRRFTTYADASKATIVSTTTVMWSLQADTATSLLACFDSVTTTAAGATSRAAECLPFDAAGNIAGAAGDTLRVVDERDGFTYVFEYRPN